MMPAESVAGTVSVGSDPRAQRLRLLNGLLACPCLEILVHTTSLTGRRERTSRSVVSRTTSILTRVARRTKQSSQANAAAGPPAEARKDSIRSEVSPPGMPRSQSSYADRVYPAD